jgi:monoterpene epsilon-lactone hydrolase
MMREKHLRNTALAGAAVEHPLVPEDRAAMAKIREVLAAAPTGPLDRAGFDEIVGRTVAADGIAFETGVVGGVPGLWCRPHDALTRSVILYLHGGAYVLGSPQAYKNLVSQIARRVRSIAFIPDYALAPERPFPSAISDALAVYHGMVSEGFTDLALIGDSAGGGLVLVLLALVASEARHGMTVFPKGAVAVSPWTDLALTGQSLQSRAHADPILRKDILANAAAQYLDGHDPNDPLASPLYGNVTGLPPIQLHVGEDEILFDDARRYAEAVVAAHGGVQFHSWEGMLHVFPTHIGVLQAAHAALDEIAAFLNSLSIAT